MPKRVVVLMLREVVQMLVATACVILVLLVMANNPSADEFYKGVPAALVGYLGSRLSSGAQWYHPSRQRHPKDSDDWKWEME